MLSKLIECLKREQLLVSKMLELAKIQQQALINFETAKIEELALDQDHLAKQLRNHEEARIKIMMTWLNISRNDAMNLKLSVLENKLKDNEMIEVKRIRIAMKKLVSEWQNTNNTNRILANRAKNNVQNILMALTNNGNRIFNMKV